MKRILGIIPARKGSKRVPDKNFRDFAGKPLFTYVTEAALQSPILTDIVISTDHEDIIRYAAAHYPKVITLKRPEEISTDAAPAIDYVHHALHHLKSAFGKSYDIIVILQPSSPFTMPSDIDNTVNLLLTSGADSAVSVVKVDHMVHPVKMKTMGDRNNLLPFLEEENNRMAANELPEVYVRNCSVYASTLATIQNNLIIGKDCRGYVMPAERSMDINEMIDFEFAEYLFKKNK